MSDPIADMGPDIPVASPIGGPDNGHPQWPAFKDTIAKEFRDRLFAVANLSTIEPVNTPAGMTFVRTMSAGEKDDFDINASKDKKFRCRLVLLCCCDEHGNRVFTSEDLPRLDLTPAYVLEPIIDAALRINRISNRDAEEIRKN